MTVIGTGFDHRPGRSRAPREPREGAPTAGRASPIASARTSRSPTTTSTSRRSCADRHAPRAAAGPGDFGLVAAGASASLRRRASAPPPCAARRSSSATWRPARRSSSSPAGRCRCSTRACAQEHLAVREAAAIFDVSHMGEIETRGPQALELLQRLLSNDVAADRLGVGGGGAQYSVLCREDGGVLDDLFTYRLDDRALPDRHERREPRARPGLVRARTPRDFPDARGERPDRRATRCSPCRARSRGRSCRRSPTRRCPRA